MPAAPPQQAISLRELLGYIERRPRMYLFEERFTALIGYLHGYDAATEGGALHGFRDWLGKRLGLEDSNFGWPGMIIEERERASGHAPRSWAELSDEENRQLLADAFHYLDQYLEEREQIDGAAAQS